LRRQGRRRRQGRPQKSRSMSPSKSRSPSESKSQASASRPFESRHSLTDGGLLARRRQDVLLVLALDVAGRIVVADPDLAVVARRFGASEPPRSDPHELREMARGHGERTLLEAVVLALAVPHLGSAFGAEGAGRATGEVLTVLAPAVFERAA